ncbi:hypothetical protein LX99_03626 [Mucilaginibacter oryzae]|uniref:ApeA N-terminal domain-containing protein n=1 Tax=Mucilaginibacter oryzae TaxID=468058 RepID=A0A316H644_9SPHI|nr:hypothetical protein [Mucilaginibacter oryzae]PWK75893.1 hypothetical protein LX99_03626 [Mucilaginibacter oryzae]
MSLKLLSPLSNSDKIFETIAFIEERQKSYFLLSDSSGEEIRIKYIPLVDASWDPTRFDLFFLDNPYLNAENDVFQVYCDEKKERLGWIFPITVLISNDNDFSDNRNLNRYKYVAQYKLLNDYAKILKPTDVNTDLLITDIYNDSTLICILSRDTIETINDFNFNNYRLSLYKYGYSIFQEDFIRKPVLAKNDFVDEMRRQRLRINLKKAKFNISSNKYVESLFIKHLLKTDDSLVRFIFLYQIIEQLMEDEFNDLFENYLNDYTSKKITKNDFKEYINTASKERDLIKSVFNNTTISIELQREFEEAFSNLFDSLDYKTRSSLPDRIYDFRNLVTHSYRNVIDKETIITELVQIFEDIIIYALINYNKNPIALAEAS